METISKDLICGKGRTTGRMGIFVFMPLSLLIPGIRSGPEFLAATYVVEHHPAEQSLDQSHRNTGRIKWASKIIFTLSRGQKKISHPKTFPNIAEKTDRIVFPYTFGYQFIRCQACSAKALTYTRLRRNLHKPAMQKPSHTTRLQTNLNKTLKATQKMSDGYKCS